MKNFLNAIYEICITMGKARAATALAREGRYAEARELMVK